ncbi:hypothetical protein R1sor_016981 [Riccia sorocarpa]|uniref:Reverse transcriptase domain-containing protein n=1 Tax=Riccia sorocarpa TaxID=122646 RepID=A0ABD3IBN6_9MARC
MLKSKYKREAIESLVKEDGALITEHEEILRETQVFYQNLFREEEASTGEEWEEETTENLRLLTNQVCPEQRGRIERVPDMEELERTVDLLPPEKSPGLDGVTSEAPLMAMLRNEQVKGQIQGLEAGNGRQILEALFADDTGLLIQAEETEWRKAEKVIRRFETMSGAKLNVVKSLVVPTGFEEPPVWLAQSGRRITTEREVWSHLGCPLGVNLSEEQEVNPRALGLTKDGYQEPTKLCRRFVWGVNKEGYDKKALIAWQKICKRKEDGGPGLISFDLQAKALKLKQITNLKFSTENA